MHALDHPPAIDRVVPLRARRPSDPFRELDSVEAGQGVAVQFGTCAVRAYNACAKTTISHKLGYVDSGIGGASLEQDADDMPTGVAYFVQTAWDSEGRGEADIDSPALVLGTG
jgi:hypothetical protein